MTNLYIFIKVFGSLENKKKSQKIINLGQGFGIGLMLVVLVLIGFYLGKYLDEKFNTTPFLSVLGIFVGFIGGCIETYRLLIKS